MFIQKMFTAHFYAIIFLTLFQAVFRTNFITPSLGSIILISTSMIVAVLNWFEFNTIVKSTMSYRLVIIKQKKTEPSLTRFSKNLIVYKSNNIISLLQILHLEHRLLACLLVVERLVGFAHLVRTLLL